MEAKLHAIEFTSAPTKTQFENACGDIEKFLNRMMGMMLADGTASAMDQYVGQVLTAANTLRQARDISAGSAGLALPQAQRPQMVTR